MLANYLRLGLLLPTLIASLQVAAENRVWTLSGVQFDDGAVATGYVTFDVNAGRITDWNIRVDQGESSWPIGAAFTYVPGNSIWISVGNTYTFVSDFNSLSSAVAMEVGRNFFVQYLAPLSGTSPVPLSDNTEEAWYPGNEARSYRFITRGSLVLAASEGLVTVVQVDEFYNPTLGHYFITADPSEKRDLDTGRHAGWVRTGEFFKAHATGSPAGGSLNPVCRYYGTPLAGLDSHFYSADADECARVIWTYGASAWLQESDNVFQINLPDKTSGACHVGTVPLYRLWNRQVDSNHRYTTSVAIRAQMLAAGYVAEGYGPDGVVMCVVQ